jgi:hypothetical protein
MKTCKHPTCEGSCRRVKTVRKRVPVKKVSDKRAKLDKIYSAMRKVYLKQNPLCVCGARSEQVHHKLGRLGGNYLNTSTWLAVCYPCHSKIEREPVWAKEKGYSGSRLNTPD